MWVLHPLQHLHLIVNHLLVAFNVLLEYNLHGNLSVRAVCFPYDAICAGAQRLPEAVFGSTDLFSKGVVDWGWSADFLS